jgi:microcystin-dependent protein
MEGTMAVVTCFAGNFPPRTWAYCNGQLMAISQNSALFSLLGTTYGGDGVTTFALPNLQNRTAIGEGQGPGLGSYTLGQPGGSATATLVTANLPQHTHTGPMQVALRGSSGGASESAPDGNYPATLSQGYSNTVTPGVNMASPVYGGNIQIAGLGTPFSLMPPYLGMSYIICITGIFPSRN